MDISILSQTEMLSQHLKAVVLLRKRLLIEEDFCTTPILSAAFEEAIVFYNGSS